MQVKRGDASKVEDVWLVASTHKGVAAPLRHGAVLNARERAGRVAIGVCLRRGGSRRRGLLVVRDPLRDTEASVD